MFEFKNKTQSLVIPDRDLESRVE